MDKSHLTAIVRKVLPKPTRWILEHGHILGNVLDYGCGRCHEVNNKHFVADGFDPHFRPDGIHKAQYDTIICNYVLNVIEDPFKRRSVLYHIDSLLAPGGRAWVSVRSDVRLDHVTSKGTWQGAIFLPSRLLHECSIFRLYEIKKGDYAPKN